MFSNFSAFCEMWHIMNQLFLTNACSNKKVKGHCYEKHNQVKMFTFVFYEEVLKVR